MMNIYFDLLFLGVLIVGYYLGHKTGIIGSLFYLFSGFVGMVIVQRFGHQFPVSAPAVFAVAVVGFIVVGLVLRKIFNWVFLNLFDRLFGGMLGIALAVIVMVNVLVINDNFKGQDKVHTAVIGSLSYRYVLTPWQVFVPSFPEMRTLTSSEYVLRVVRACGFKTEKVEGEIRGSHEKVKKMLDSAYNNK